MLFPKIDLDAVVQVNDMFRVDAQGSFSTTDEPITSVKIYPDYTNDPLITFTILPDCPEDFYLDWAYEIPGDYTVRVELVSDSGTKELDRVVTAISEAEDNLQSDDSSIYVYESELKKYLPEGRNSYKYIHRKALEEILDYLYRNGKLNPDCTKITKDQLITKDIQKWATFEAILLIFQDIKSSNAEAFNEKIIHYLEKRGEARSRYIIEIDTNRDNVIDEKDTKSYTAVSYFTR